MTAISRKSRIHISCKSYKMSGTEDEFELSDEDDGDVSDCTISDLDSSSGETDDDYER